ncbi:MAG: exodeoxyribonuclease VII large subunit [Syntrophomonadaceae bacterium]|nr:exodeoxyribonuclease VII large subunit [Syntrophomonadaceae bacterium]
MQEFITVSELNNYIGGLLEGDLFLSNFWLKGELSGFKLYQQSGHMYFNLKDTDSLISCVMFKSRARGLAFKPEDGMEVLLRGTVSVFARQGKYQVYAEEMLPFGAGGLYLQLEKTKAKLQALGYFDPEHKQPLPRMVNRLGIVTSQDGAALRDILKVVRQRHALIDVVLVHSSVQGLEAPQELARGIELLNQQDSVDLIIVGRGGGSLEDLMAFNSEEVVRAIYQSHIPIISAVGHEVDYTLADLAADIRAATPTHAAQIAVPDVEGILNALAIYQQRMQRAIEKKLGYNSERLDRIMMRKIWSQPGIMIESRQKQVEVLEKGLRLAMSSGMQVRGQRLALAVTALDKLSPLKVLSRGYAIASKDGTVIHSSEQVEPGDQIDVTLYEGRLKVRVESKEGNPWKA